jgi:hypothetical protein
MKQHHRSRLLRFAVSLCVLGPHSAFAQSITSVVARRDQSTGAIVITGKTTLPRGTRLRVSVSASPDVVAVTVDGRGAFDTPGIGLLGRPVVDSSMTARIQAAFTAAEQPQSVLALTGVGAVKLPSPENELQPDVPLAPMARDTSTRRYPSLSRHFRSGRWRSASRRGHATL